MFSSKKHRPWGYYEILSDKKNHKVKRITVKPGHRLSLQRHFKRSEHWYVVSGYALVTLGDKFVVLSPGMSIDIPVKSWHRVENSMDLEYKTCLAEDLPNKLPDYFPKEDLVFIEVQTGTYFGEDDIERKEDIYGRV